MKFADGYWHFRTGITPHFPVHVYGVEAQPDALLVYGTTRRLNGRGDTINSGLLTVRFRHFCLEREPRKQAQESRHCPYGQSPKAATIDFLSLETLWVPPRIAML